MKCRGMITDYGIELIESENSTFNGMPKVKVTFELSDKEEVEDGFKYTQINWEGLFVNKEGELNKATAKNLLQMGFKEEDPIVLADGPESESLDMDFLYFIDLEKNDGGYWNVKWISKEEFTGGVKEIKKASKESLQKKMASLKIKGDLRKMFEANKAKEKTIENKAPEFNSSEEIPF